ncbi:hypothetical protein J6590_030255 [Homalodisca vitripennis]|nr:hypothetical protein J6590_030255 [Homalodisca vitripennis]
MFSKFKSSDLGIIAMALEEEDEERRKQRPVTRRKWVDNAWKRRTIEGEFYTLMPHLIDNETKFYEYFRMSLITFHKLLSKVEAHLHKEDTFWRQAITPKHRLAVCLSRPSVGAGSARLPRGHTCPYAVRASMFSKFKSSDLGIIAMALEEEDEERRKQRPVTRRKWVDNAWKRRTIEGEFYTLMPHLIDNETKFYEYFRMSLITFHKLLSKVEAHLHKEDTFWRQAITPKHRLAVCLR